MFVVDWDSDSIESYDENQAEDGSRSQKLNSFSASFHKEGLDPEL